MISSIQGTNNNLKTQDIKGAQVGTVNHTGFNINYTPRVTKGMQSLKNDDIDGTAASSLLKNQALIKKRTQDVNNNWFNSASVYGHF